MLTVIPSTAIDIYRMLPEGTRCEVIDNILTMLPSNTSQHQLTLSAIAVPIYNHLLRDKLGEIIPGPIDLYFDDNLSVVQPDLLILLNEHLDYIKPDGVYGAPDMVIEILSASNRLHDTQKKKSLYEKAGVKEYFIVDPANKEVSLYTLTKSGTYKEIYQEKNVIKSALLDCKFIFR